MKGLMAPGAAVSAPSDEGHFTFSSGCALEKCSEFPAGRYLGQKLLGSGTYGKVVECIDQKHKARTAVKLVRRGIPAYRECALKEIKILRELGGMGWTPKMLRNFHHDGHVCIVFDLLGDSVASALQNRYSKALYMIHLVRKCTEKIVLFLSQEASAIFEVGDPRHVQATSWSSGLRAQQGDYPH